MIPKGKGLPKYADDAELNQIRGKAMVGHQTIGDVWTLLDHLQLLEHTPQRLRAQNRLLIAHVVEVYNRLQ